MSKRTYVQVEEPSYSLFSLPKLPIEYLLVIYARQSAKDAPIRNKESYDMQTVRLVEYGHELGWLDNIIVKIENKRKDGKWRSASGTLRIDQREGLQSVVWSIEEGECKAVMVWAVDRLFRHEDMVEPAVFVRICKEHNCIILTPDDFFDFNNPKRDDRRRFLELAQQAADYVTKHVKGRMLPARHQVSRRGDYDGRTIPTGFILFNGEKKPHEYAPQAEIIRTRIFKRFRELDAQFNLLWREIAPVRDLFPPYPQDAVGVKGYMKEGPFGITRSGLEEILTNVAYIGYWYFREKGKSPVIIENNHESIVDEEDFWFAFNRRSKTTITGEPNEHRNLKPHTRFTRVGTDPAQALLDGVISSPLPGYHVYVYQMADKPCAAIYNVRGPEHVSLTADRASISIGALDRIFEEKLEYRLKMFQAIDALRAKAEPGKPRETSMYEYLKEVQSALLQSHAGVATQLEEYEIEAESLEKTLHFGAKDLDVGTIIRFSQRLAKLNATIPILRKKSDEATKTDEALKETANLLVDASVSYKSMRFDRRQKLVRMVTTKIELSEIIPRWLKLVIEWSPFLAVTVRDIAYIWRPNTGEDWTDEEERILKSLYPEDRETILKALPQRSWSSIRIHAFKKGLRRPKPTPTNCPLTDLSVHLSYNDLKYMQENGLEYTQDQIAKQVWWRVVAIENNETSPIACQV